MSTESKGREGRQILVMRFLRDRARAILTTTDRPSPLVEATDWVSNVSADSGFEGVEHQLSTESGSAIFRTRLYAA
jgi:hypothetical protein